MTLGSKLPPENTEPWPATQIEIAKEYFPDATPAELENIIWGLTGFPNFWHIGTDGDTPLQCFHTCLRKVRELLDQGISIDEQLYNSWERPLLEHKERIRVRAYYLWLEAGKPEGRSDEFWTEAEDVV